MFGPRLIRIFANRWMALWWAATILLLVWQLVPSADDGGGASPAAAHDGAAVNPWALTPTAGTGDD